MLLGGGRFRIASGGCGGASGATGAWSITPVFASAAIDPAFVSAWISPDRAALAPTCGEPGASSSVGDGVRIDLRITSASGAAVLQALEFDVILLFAVATPFVPLDGCTARCLACCEAETRASS